ASAPNPRKCARPAALPSSKQPPTTRITRSRTDAAAAAAGSVLQPRLERDLAVQQFRDRAAGFRFVSEALELGAVQPCYARHQGQRGFSDGETAVTRLQRHLALRLKCTVVMACLG